MLPLLLSALAGWLLGSVPTAYLLVRVTRGIDLTRAGSTNVGANNAFRTTGSRWVGIAVLVLDAAKGALAVLAGFAITGWIVAAPGPSLLWWGGSAALLAAITGHNYNLFLSLRCGTIAGGKGLATAAGGFLILTPVLVGIWLLLWVMGFLLFAWWRGVRDAIPGNVLATALIPLGAWLLFGVEGFFVVTVFAALVLPKHVRQMRAHFTRSPAAEAAEFERDDASTDTVQEGVNPADMT